MTGSRIVTALACAARWTFTGAGNGHGVGLCQVGDRAARAGYDYERILRHDLHGTEVAKAC